MDKKKLLVSFSGGESSAYMAQWLWNHKQDEYDMIFVFANTGQENEETLDFVRKCSLIFKFPIIWIEAKVNPENRKGTRHKIVNYYTASREGEIFEDVIKKYGIPNISTPHCTRELKQNPIKSYAKSIGWKKYYTAIGIRMDEMDRQNEKAEQNKFLYPLISKEFQPMTKPMINFWWKQQPFRLELKGYQGNCMTCWKKSDHKLFQIAKENQRAFLFMDKMEQKYGEFVPATRIFMMKKRGEQPNLPTTFFRKKRSARDIINESKSYTGFVIDDSVSHDLLGGDNCEVFAECGG